jgi:hypothetical protein
MFYKKICQKRSLYVGIKNFKKLYYIKHEMWPDRKIFLPFFTPNSLPTILEKKCLVSLTFWKVPLEASALPQPYDASYATGFIAYSLALTGLGFMLFAKQSIKYLKILCWFGDPFIWGHWNNIHMHVHISTIFGKQLVSFVHFLSMQRD